MSGAKPLTEEQVIALHAWVLVLQRAHPRDRRMIAIGALGDLGNGQWIVCPPCIEAGRSFPARMHFHEAYAHLRDVAGPHHLDVERAAVTVKP